MIEPTSFFYILFVFFLFSQSSKLRHFIISLLFNDSGEHSQKVENVTDSKEKRYEDKFLVEIRKMDNNFVFNEQELELIKEKKTEFLKMVDDAERKNEELSSKLILEQQNELQICSKGYICDYEEFEMNAIHCRKEEINKEIQNVNEILKFKDTTDEKARDFVISQRMKTLEGCYVMEHTPQGNVLMIYDSNRSSFKYYSDNAMPYRYLEVVARKYVKMFNCRPIYVDMEEELQIAEEKWKKDNEKEKELEKESDKESEVTHKKNVFAKFKSYNREGGSGRVNTAVPPKNSINAKREHEENRKVVLKDNANRYTYDGKFVNFNFLKKIERKMVDKKYALSFADFKKMQNQKAIEN